MGYTTRTSNSAAPPLRRVNTCPPSIIDSMRTERKKRRRASWSGTGSATKVPLVMPDRSENGTSSTSPHSSDDDYFRKVQAALTGGAMVGVGLVMIPLPVPMGVVVAGAGLSVLGKEFPAAQRLLDNTKGAIHGVLGKVALFEEEAKDEVVAFEEEKDDDYLLNDLDYSRFDESKVVKYEWRYEEEIIFSSIENSEVFNHIRRPTEEAFVNVWTA